MAHEENPISTERDAAGNMLYCQECGTDMHAQGITSPNAKIYCLNCTGEMEDEGYISSDLTPPRIMDMLAGLTAVAGLEDPEHADLEALESYINALNAWSVEVLLPAVSGLIEVHRRTGIDLKHWEPVLRLAQSADPTFSIEGEPEW